MDSEFVKCPYCGEVIGRSELKEIFDADKNVIICPNCNEEISIDEL